MQVAITGATGFIGSHLVDTLLARGWEVRLLRHRRLPHRSDVKIIDGEIDSLSDLISLFKGVDVVFHLASAMGSSPLSPEDFFRINLKGTKTVLEAAREAGVSRVVHVSSAGVLGNVPKGIVADESYPPHPLTIYDRSKWAGEKAVLEASSLGQDVVVVRPGWVYGPRDRRTFKVIQAIKNHLFFLVGDGSCRQSPVWIHDLISGLLLCTEKGEKGKIYHLAGGEILTVKEMAETIAKNLGVSIPPFHIPVFVAKTVAFVLERVWKPLRKEPPLNTARLSFFLHSKPLDISLAQKELGYSPKVPFSTGIPLAIQWYKENGWL